MAVETILVCDSERPAPAMDVILLHITNRQCDTEPALEYDAAKDGYLSVVTARVSSYQDAHSTLADFLNRMAGWWQRVTVAVWSDCDAVCARDAEVIASMIMRTTPVQYFSEMPSGVCQALAYAGR